MITYEEARQLAQERIASWNHAPTRDSLIILDCETIEKDWGWVFFYTSRLWHETKDFRHALAGNAPFIVERDSGCVLDLGTAFNLEHYLDRYEMYGNPHFEPGPKIRLVGCLQNVDRMAAARLIRDRSGIGLQMAKQLIEDCIKDRKPCINSADPKTTDEFAQNLESIGFVVERLSKNDTSVSHQTSSETTAGHSRCSTG
jgi:hypothetical protein